MSQQADDGPTVGILAYGSLISNPKCEIEEGRAGIIEDIMTPFRVEFARKSKGRGWAPTLVPVASGGTHVKGKVFVMNLTEAKAADALYRREIDEVGSGKIYQLPEVVTEKHVVVERLAPFAGLDVVLYTQLADNIEPLTAERLAGLAIRSVYEADPGRDGISYLIDAKEHGIVTALSPGYEAAILQELGCETLEEALDGLRACGRTGAR